MKKPLLSFVAALLISFTGIRAKVPAETGTSFKSPDEEVALDIQRGTGEVKLHIIVRDISQFDHVVVERSAESPNYFGNCKYISGANAKSKTVDIIETDRYPYAAAKDVYYRIKTVTKDGIERAYPALMLTAVNK